MTRRVDLLAVDEVPEGTMKMAFVDETDQVIVVHTGGEIRAFQGICTHEYFELDKGFLTAGTLTAGTLTAGTLAPRGLAPRRLPPGTLVPYTRFPDAGRPRPDPRPHVSAHAHSRVPFAAGSLAPPRRALLSDAPRRRSLGHHPSHGHR